MCTRTQAQYKTRTHTNALRTVPKGSSATDVGMLGLFEEGVSDL